MMSNTFMAISAFAVVFVVSLPLRCSSDEPVLRVGHGVTAPRAVNPPDPEYSEEARRAGLQGTCILSLVVNSEGKPENVVVSRSLGMGLDEKAIEAVRNWTFEPARKDGKPVAVQVRVLVTFRTGKHAMTPDARKELEKMQKAYAEFRRTRWKRVYRTEGATPAPLCRSTHKEGENDAAQVSILGPNTDLRQYDLESITFVNNKIITNAAALRALFPIKDGESFDPQKVAQGLQELKMAYGVQGFVSFKASVDPKIDDLHGRIALRITCDEGRQFSVDHINIAGLDENTFQKLRKSLYVKPGDVYNERLGDLWLEKNSRLIAPDNLVRDRLKLDVNENDGTLVMTYDFTRCTE